MVKGEINGASGTADREQMKSIIAHRYSRKRVVGASRGGRGGGGRAAAVGVRCSDAEAERGGRWWPWNVGEGEGEGGSAAAGYQQAITDACRRSRRDGSARLGREGGHGSTASPGPGPVQRSSCDRVLHTVETVDRY